MSSWEVFFKDSVTKIFSEKKEVIDIGGSLRMSRTKGNRYSPQNAWIEPLASKVDYKILDPVPDYHPDIVGDIHKLPLPDNSVEAIICISVLEHVEDPHLAMREMYRTLKPGGYLLVFVPFLYYYHAEGSYYKDYWRFTKDTVELLFKPFASSKYVSVRGPFETIFHLFPGGKSRPVKTVARMLEKIFRKKKSNQVSGYFIFAVK